MLRGDGFRQAQRFAVSGVLATGLHAAIATGFIVLIWPLPALANAIAFALASIFSYTANTLWSFSRTPDRRSLLRFIAVSGFGCLLAVVIASIAEYYGLHYLIGIALVVMTLPPLTFLLHKFWTYR